MARYLLFLIFCTYFQIILWNVADSDSNGTLNQNNIENSEAAVSSSAAVEDEGGGLQSSSSGGLLKGNVVTEVKIHPNGSVMSLGNKYWDEIVSDLLSRKIETNDTTEDSNKKMSTNDPLTTVVNERFSCISCDNYDCHDSSYCYNAVQCFQARERDSTGTETYSRGCILKLEQISFICSSSFHHEVEGLVVKCCEGNLCNNEDYPHLPHPSAGPAADSTYELLKLAFYVILGTFLFVGSFISVIYLLMTRCFLQHKNKYMKGFSQRSSLNPFAHIRDASKFASIEDSTSRGILNESLSSGSGSGLPLFVQRTLAKNIYLEDIIGKGRYGEVWKGLWHGETVAVKIFFTRDEASWARETEVFSSALLRHENILGFYGADKTCRASCTQLWLVTHYHPHGSLCHYLKSNVLNHQELFAICLSIINGLLHLHTEITGTQGKPAIAHRDLNSNNILVKEEGTCCISDFGLAVIRSPGTGEVNIGTSDRSGTRRYMSPEILDGTMDMEQFESFRKADIYAVALVMWEVCRRTLCNGIAEDYLRPFGNLLPSEPSYEEMQKLVCVHGTRPSIPNRWKDDRVLTSLERILNECWHRNPNVRLTALRIKKNLLKISNEELMDDMKPGHKIV